MAEFNLPLKGDRPLPKGIYSSSPGDTMRWPHQKFDWNSTPNVQFVPGTNIPVPPGTNPFNWGRGNNTASIFDLNEPRQVSPYAPPQVAAAQKPVNEVTEDPIFGLSSIDQGQWLTTRNPWLLNGAQNFSSSAAATPQQSAWGNFANSLKPKKNGFWGEARYIGPGSDLKGNQNR